MTNTPMTSRDIVKSVKQPKPYWEINKSYTNNQMFDYALECVEASQAQQASVIAELVEALEEAIAVAHSKRMKNTKRLWPK